MRRIIAILFLVLTVLAIPSCGTDADDDGKLTVVTTIFPQYDFVRAIGGDEVNVKMLLSPAAESHTYEPTLADIALISEADLFVYTGGGIDTWAEDIADSLKDEDVKSYAVSSAVSFVCAVEAADHDHAHTDGVCTVDEHVWTSPKNAILIFDGILELMMELDPENAEEFRENADLYRSELVELDGEFAELTEQSAVKDIVFADRFPFIYLTEDYGLSYHAALSGCSVGQEPTAAKIGELCDIVIEKGIKYVFIIENSDGAVAQVISEATGCGVLTLHSCHNVSAEEFSSGVTYVSLMRANLENLRLALE